MRDSTRSLPAVTRPWLTPPQYARELGVKEHDGPLVDPLRRAGGNQCCQARGNQAAVQDPPI
jgi:hypothetical protein